MIFRMYISQVSIEIHHFVIAQDKMYISFGSIVFIFERIDQPLDFIELIATIKKVTSQYQMAFTKCPIQIFIYDTVGLQ